MLKIWICDDEQIFTETLSECIQKSLASCEIDAEVRSFHSAEAFLAELDMQIPDLAFLDLMLKESDGYALAEEMRRRRVESEFVFVTNYPERMPQAFAYRPIGFVPKPLGQPDVEILLHRFFTFYSDRTAVYSFRTRERDCTIPLKDILYFESSAHRLYIYTTDQSQPYVHSRRLDDVETELKSHAFVRCHKSFLVALSAIAQVDRSHMRLLLRNEASLPVSRSCFNHTMDRIIQYRLR